MKSIAKFLKKENPSWFKLPDSSSETQTLGAITARLSRTYFKMLEMKGCVKMEKDGRNTAVKITDFGRVRLKILGVI